MTETEKRVPELRFEGFVEDWEQRKLIGEIDKVLDYRGKSPTKFGMKWESTGYLVLSALNVKDGYIDKAVDAKCGNQALFERWMGFERLEKGDVIFTTEAPLGNVAQIPDDDGYILNQRAVGFKTNPDNLNNNFLAQLLRTPLFQNKLQANASGGTAKGIGMKEFAKLDVTIPLEIDEQKRVGNFFNLIDDTIALHLCKQHQLEALKQSLIKDILPQNDSVIPRLRFANFIKPWEHHQLKEVLKINSGRDYKHLNEGDIPVYGTGGYMLSVDGKLSNVDGIGLGRKGTIDKPQYLKAPFWTVDTLFYLTPLPNHDIYFLFTLTQSINWKTMDESTGVPSLSKAVIEKVTRTFPSLEEQQKIGSFFKQLDETIFHHQQKN